MKTFSELTSVESDNLLAEMKLAGKTLANAETKLGTYRQVERHLISDRNRISDVYFLACSRSSVIPDGSTDEYFNAVVDAYNQFQTNSVEG